MLKDRKKEAPATLEDVSMLPSIARGFVSFRLFNSLANIFSSSTTRCVGRLRAHVNGFRFTSEKQGEIDVIYSNIKFFFYQPPTKAIYISPTPTNQLTV